MMMIAFITCKSSLVPLLEGLWSSNSWEFEVSGFRRNRTDDQGINSPSLWPTEPRLHVRSTKLLFIVKSNHHHQALHFSFVQRNQPTNARTSLYPRPAALIPSTPHPLVTTYPRTFRSLRSFTMAPCVVVERLEGKQQCNRVEVTEHAGIQARKWSSWLFTKKREVNETWKRPNPEQPTHNHDSAANRQHLAHLHWCGADPPSS